MHFLNTPKRRGIFTAVALLSIGLFTTWLLMFVLFPVSQTIVQRKSSPTGQFEAVLKETQSGNSATRGYYVYIEQKSMFSNSPLVASFYGAKRNEQSNGVDLEWVNPSLLRIQYWRAESASSPRETIQCGSDTIHVEQVSGVKAP